MNRADRAIELFHNNFNCSQAVFTVFATEYGIREDLALKLATSFGGGARNGEMCGAVSGALMVLGLKFGHFHADNPEEKQRAYSLVSEFVKRFIEVNRSIVCRDLLGYNLAKEDEFERIVSEGLYETICPNMVRTAVDIVEQIIDENE
ncbi:MAG: C-GCAxxG-C-C family protein [Faecousia sp.]